MGLSYASDSVKLIVIYIFRQIVANGILYLVCTYFIIRSTLRYVLFENRKIQNFIENFSENLDFSIFWFFRKFRFFEIFIENPMKILIFRGISGQNFKMT